LNDASLVFRYVYYVIDVTDLICKVANGITCGFKLQTCNVHNLAKRHTLAEPHGLMHCIYATAE
jgi:hypothetical protein